MLATPSSDMEYVFYCRAKPDSDALWAQLTEAHWWFMDGYADAMIARGPTLAADRATATGSMHMVERPDDAAARVFAFEEHCYVAGVSPKSWCAAGATRCDERCGSQLTAPDHNAH